MDEFAGVEEHAAHLIKAVNSSQCGQSSAFLDLGLTIQGDLNRTAHLCLRITSHLGHDTLRKEPCLAKGEGAIHQP